MNESSMSAGGDVVLYEAPDGEVRLDVRLEPETVWLTQRQMAILFETTSENVLMHLKNRTARESWWSRKLLRIS